MDVPVVGGGFLCTTQLHEWKHCGWMKLLVRYHQMARIIRHNDESVREGYVRNGAKEVKLFRSVLKAFQCNNRIDMAQRKHLDDFSRGRIIGRLECGRTQLEVSEELGIA
ncbi:transposable element Tcb2 transposase [Trichonephila clavipes]|uniref:Transposable element Tcb2 transposase n=1 Tax=Trichonephila clavipes TaxID=2585209 RepID=A0A8X6R0T2_TRICX|nr:transposable element Tcb2 transposase [Trichonephila clavipes]